MNELLCERCGDKFDNKNISPRYISINLDKYKLCPNCRKYKLCKNCNVEFKHHQNQTCSKKCAQELKEKSFIESCGSKHNFSKESKSRLEWQKRLLDEEGIVNVFQRECVKEKSKSSIIKKFGVDNISKSPMIKLIKEKTLKNTILLYPNIIKDKWHETHNRFLDKIGYDPRLHMIGKASKESLIIFNPLIEWCINNINILIDDIYIGIDDKKEYFIPYNKKIFFYDFTIKSKKIIIEFNGVLFHAKDEFSNWNNPFTNESAFDNIKRNELKKNIAINNGFKLIEIWSDEDPIINLELCKKFIISNI